MNGLKKGSKRTSLQDTFWALFGSPNERTEKRHLFKILFGPFTETLFSKLTALIYSHIIDKSVDCSRAIVTSYPASVMSLPPKDAKVAPVPGKTPTKNPPNMLQRRMSFKSAKSFDISSFQNLIDKSAINDPEKTPVMEIIRLRVKKYIATTFLGQLYVNVLLILSVLSCAQYIYQSYLKDTIPREEKILNIFSLVELFLAGLFAFDWCLNIFIADHRWEHFFRCVIVHIRHSRLVDYIEII